MSPEIRPAPAVGQHNDEVLKCLFREENVTSSIETKVTQGEENVGKFALEGLRVIELGWALAQPFGGS